MSTQKYNITTPKNLITKILKINLIYLLSFRFKLNKIFVFNESIYLDRFKFLLFNLFNLLLGVLTLLNKLFTESSYQYAYAYAYPMHEESNESNILNDFLLLSIDKGKGKEVAGAETNYGSDDKPIRVRVPSSDVEEEVNSLTDPWAQGEENFSDDDYAIENSELIKVLEASREYYRKLMFGTPSAGEGSNTASSSTHSLSNPSVPISTLNTPTSSEPTDAVMVTGGSGMGSVSTRSSVKYSSPPLASDFNKIPDTELNSEFETTALSNIDVTEMESDPNFLKALSQPTQDVKKYLNLLNQRQIIDGLGRELFSRYQIICKIIKTYKEQLADIRFAIWIDQLFNRGNQHFYLLDELQSIQEKIDKAKKLETYFHNRLEICLEQLIQIDISISKIRGIILLASSDTLNFISTDIFVHLQDFFTLYASDQLLILSDMCTLALILKILNIIIKIIIRESIISYLKLDKKIPGIARFLRIRQKYQKIVLWGYIFIFIAGIIIKILSYFINGV